MKPCKKCGYQNPKNAKFCIRCGSKLKKQSTFIPWIWGIGFLIIAILIVFGFYIFSRKTQTPSASLTPSQSNHTINEPISEERITFYSDDKVSGFVNDTIIVYFKSDSTSDEQEAVIQKYSNERPISVASLPIYKVYVEAADEDSLKALCDKISNESIVNTATLDSVSTLSPELTIPYDEWKPTESMISQQPDIYSYEYQEEWNENIPDGLNWGLEAVRVPSAWDYSNYFNPIKVGIIDAGFELSHPDLEITALSPEINDLEDNENNIGHGTAVSGVVGAKWNNIGISGIVRDSEIYGYNFVHSVPYVENIDLIDIMKLCFSKGCKTLNFSVGKSTEGTADELHYAAQESAATLVRCLLYLESITLDDYLIIQAAGNDFKGVTDIEKNMINGYGFDSRLYNGFFCSIDETLFNEIKAELNDEYLNRISFDSISRHYMVVANVDYQNRNGQTYHLAPFSSYGEAVDVCAPGTLIYTTSQNNSYGLWNGTSFSAPIVTGIASLVWSINPKFSSKDVKSILIDAANFTVLPGLTMDSTSSYRMVNAQAAVEKAINYIPEEIRVPSEEAYLDDSNNNISRKDIVIAIDRSDSMTGEPMDNVKEATIKFLDQVELENANFSLVTYNSTGSLDSGFTDNKQNLKKIINNLQSSSSTNMGEGLEIAGSLLSQSDAKERVILLFSDGLPTDGMDSSELISYAEMLKNQGIRIYTLGYYESINYSGLELMSRLASENMHFQINSDHSSGNSVEDFFALIASFISGDQYMYIEAACPVDVSVTFGDETLSSKDNEDFSRTSFGMLTYLYEEDRKDKTKILRLKTGNNYDIEISGYDDGKMDYSISLMDENGNYTDTRQFEDLPITQTTKISTTANTKPVTQLRLDEDGDGVYEMKFKAGANETGYQYSDSWVSISIILIIMITIFLEIWLTLRRRRRHC